MRCNTCDGFPQNAQHDRKAATRPERNILNANINYIWTKKERKKEQYQNESGKTNT